MIKAITHPALEHPRLRHGFFTREGGVSTGVYAHLNCGPGSNDDPGDVAQNRKLAMESLQCDPARLLTCYQMHSAEVVVVDAPFADDRPTDRPKADAMVTNCADLALGILTADCAPVLLADLNAGVIAALHAGWKGALAGIVENTVVAMLSLGAKPENLVGVIGPTIHQASYEVGAELRALAMQSVGGGAARFFKPSTRDGHWMFDLGGLVASRLKDAGVGNCQSLGLDTYPDEKRFFSYRRTTHQGQTDYGRLLSAIVLND